MSEIEKNTSEAEVQEIVQTSEDTAVEAAAASAPAKKEKKHRLSYEKRKGLYGYGFIAIWILGTIYFFLLPLVESLIYSFNQTTVQPGGMEMKFIGWDNYVNAFRKDQDYSLALVNMLKNTALKTPLILIFAIFIAIILNQKFHGRTFARAVFFLPVIIATGPVIDIINGNMSTGGYAGGSEQFSTMFEADLVDQLLNFLGIYNISDKLTETINSLTTDIFNLVWNSGIQILLILSALQGISPASKEAAQMEGATSWEFFWKITLPHISPMILASIVYTVVDSFVDPQNEVMTIVLNKSTNWEHGYSAAMAWAYFAIIAVCLAIVCAIVNKFVYYEVD
ncbi:sugar ABC transporter permease [uncultured Ruminococcus sp.]|uniref:carbohydrate ABC transporter permease n=1 Tax=uncultured Ruminococcus sp. TaxID=165186 RepID=UPI0025FEDAEB|nr:sugar ABC transporter permease [uncultured Ruminococcus sp.]